LLFVFYNEKRWIKASGLTTQMLNFLNNWSTYIFLLKSIKHIEKK
jgi:hypothetical protein